MLLNEGIPEAYANLPGRNLSCVYDKDDKQYDLALALDCGDADRLASRIKVFNTPQRMQILIIMQRIQNLHHIIMLIQAHRQQVKSFYTHRENGS